MHTRKPWAIVCSLNVYFRIKNALWKCVKYCKMCKMRFVLFRLLAVFCMVSEMFANSAISKYHAWKSCAICVHSVVIRWTWKIRVPLLRLYSAFRPHFRPTFLLNFQSSNIPFLECNLYPIYRTKIKNRENTNVFYYA